GLATTVFPAASAGAMRQVASISGAFHGVITAVTPDGSQETRSACPETSRFPGSRWPSQSAKNSKLCATLGITLRRCERSREPLSRVSTCASSSIRARTPAAMARRTPARSAGGAAGGPAAEGGPRGPDRGVALGRPAPGYLGDGFGVDRGHVGERGGRAGPAAADPMAGVDRDAGHVRRGHGQG